MQNRTPSASARTGTIHHVTGETDVRVTLDLDGAAVPLPQDFQNEFRDVSEARIGHRAQGAAARQ